VIAALACACVAEAMIARRAPVAGGGLDGVLGEHQPADLDARP
jgi:hypothetical protein